MEHPLEQYSTFHITRGVWHRRAGYQAPIEEKVLETDPVRDMQIEKTAASAEAVYLGRTYCFCSSRSHKLFAVEPKRYAGNGEPEPKTGASAKHRR